MISIASIYITVISVALVMLILYCSLKGIKDLLILACCATMLIPFQISCPLIKVFKINELAIIVWFIEFILYVNSKKKIYISKKHKIFFGYLYGIFIVSLINYMKVCNIETLVEYFRLFITIAFPLSVAIFLGTKILKNIDNILVSWNLGATVVSILSIIYIYLSGHMLNEYFMQYFTTKTLYFYELKFISSPFIADPNSYAGYLAISLMITIYLYRKYLNKLYIISIVLELIGLISSLSRGVLLALLLIVFIYLILNERTRIIGFSILPLGLIIGISYFIPYVLKDGSASSRFGLWATALNMYKSHPVFGVGLQNYTYMFNNFRSSLVTIDTPFTHNLYLKVLVEMGAIGELFFLFICISTVWDELLVGSVNKTCMAFALATITFMIQGMSVEFFTSYFFWFMIVIGSIYTYEFMEGFDNYENICSDGNL